MSKEERKAPELRFKGFSDDWEQRKLGELSEKLEYGLNASATNYDGENKYLRITDIDDNNHKFNREFLTSPNIDISSSNHYLLKSGDILFARTGASVGKTYIYDEKDGKVYFAGFLIRARILSNNNPQFIFQNTLTKKYLNFIRVTSQRSGQPGVNANEYRNYRITVPKFNEQEKVGHFFKILDKTIDLHQRKVDIIENYKKQYLRIMFPYFNQSIPILRNKNFKEKWEQRQLNEYLITSKHKNLKGLYDKTDVLSVSGESGIVNQIEFQGRSFAGKSVLNYGVVNKADIVYTKSPLKAAPHGIVKSNKGKPGIVSTLYAVYKTKENANSNFIQIYFENDLRLNKYLKPLVNKGAKNDMKISDENVLRGMVTFPTLAEQKSVFAFFESLNEVIRIHQRKVYILEQLKQSYLHKMFL